MSDIPADESDSPHPLAGGDKPSKWQPIAERSFERNGDAELVEAVIETVAAAEGVDVTAITSPPLLETVPISALEELFFGRPIDGASRVCTGQVQFHYREWQVTVTSKGHVIVAEPVRDDAAE